MKFTTYRTPGSACLNCGKVNTGATGEGGRAPNAGDVAMCVYCGHVMIYGDDLALRPPTDAEMIEIAGDPELVAFSKARAKTREARAMNEKPFDWSRITWGRPDSPPTVVCSSCSAALSENDVPLILWNKAGYSARFCPRCIPMVTDRLIFEPRGRDPLPPSKPARE
jgi:hypothetical protein